MRNLKKISALLLAVILLGLTACGQTNEETAPAVETVEAAQVTYTDAPDTIRKAETVYVNLDNNGKTQSVSVTDWLHTDKAEVAAADRSDLKDITDIKGNMTPVRNGNELVWHMPTTDLYYRGTSDKKAPVEFDITYKLDGKKIAADAIAGKSGKVEIQVRMHNTYKKNGVYLPVIAAGLMILPEGIFSGVSVKNGIAVGDGAKEIVIGMGVPGMAESLHLKDGAKLGNIELCDSFTITAEADGFALDNLYFAVLPVCSMDLDTLIPGSEAEAEQFFAQVQDVLQTIGSFDAKTLTEALSGQKVEQIGSMMQEAVEMYNRNAVLLDVMQKYLTEENLENIGTLLKTMSDPQTAEMLDRLNNPLLRRTLSGLPETLEAIEALTPVLESLQKDMEDPRVKAAVDSLPETLETLSKLKSTLDENRAMLDLVGELADSDALPAITKLLQSDETKTVLSDITQNADDMLPHLQDYIELGKAYGLFTDGPDGAETTLLFIYMTPSLRQVSKDSDALTTTDSQPWYKKLFSK